MVNCNICQRQICDEVCNWIEALYLDPALSKDLLDFLRVIRLRDPTSSFSGCFISRFQVHRDIIHRIFITFRSRFLIILIYIHQTSLNVVAFANSSPVCSGSLILTETPVKQWKYVTRSISRRRCANTE